MAEFAAKVEIQAAPEAIWDVVCRESRLPEWFTPIREVRGAIEGRHLEPGDSRSVRMKGRVPVPVLKVHAVEEGKGVRWAAGPGFAHALGIAMQVKVSLEPREGSTTAAISFICNAITAPIQERIAGLDLQAEAEDSLARLKSLVEKS